MRGHYWGVSDWCYNDDSDANKTSHRLYRQMYKPTSLHMYLTYCRQVHGYNLDLAVAYKVVYENLPTSKFE